MSSSQNDTGCSTPENDTVEKVVKNDAVRYVRKGYGLVLAILIFLSFFGLGPIMLKSIWSDFLSLAPIKHLLFGIGFLYPTIMYAIANLIMWGIYVGEFPFFERYRISPEKLWPWQKDPIEWKKTLRKTLINLLINQVIVGGLVSAFGVWVTGQKASSDLDSFPDHWTIIKHITFMMVIEDFFFYWSHRLFHQPYFYKKIHKIHHEYYNAISLCAEYAHPLEYLCCNVLPTSAGYLILGGNVHVATFILFLSIRVFETIDGHCGYEFSWSPYRLLPLSGSSEYHNYHHSHNIGTYGSFFTYMDTLCSTNKDYFAHIARKQRKEQLRQSAIKNSKLNQEELAAKLEELKKD